MKLELQCMLEKHDIKVDKEAGLPSAGEGGYYGLESCQKKSKEKLKYENRRMAKNHVLNIEVDLNCETWLREMGKISKNSSLIKNHFKHMVLPEDKD